MSLDLRTNVKFRPPRRACLLLLSTLFFWGTSAAAQPADYENILSGLMRRHKVRGIQVYLFDATGGRDFSAGFTDASGARPVAPDTIFQAADLVRPLSAALTLSEWRKRGLDPDKDDIIPLSGVASPPLDRRPGSRALTLHHVLLLTSGFPARAPVFDVPDRTAPRALSLPADLSEPGLRITPSPESFALLEAALEKKQTSIAQLAGSFHVPGFAGSLDRPASPSVTEGFVENAGYFFPTGPAKTQVVSYNSLYTTARSYGAFLRWVEKSHAKEAREIRSLRFRYAAETGGTAPGFRIQMVPAGEVYRIEGRSPGYSSSAILMPNGRGAVILANSEKPGFHADALRALFGSVVHGEPTLCGEHQAGSPVDSLSGFYRPRGVARIPVLSFVQDLQISGEGDALSVTGILEADAARRLSRLSQNVYCIVGGPSDGTRIVVRHRTDGGIEGLDTDLVQYDRVSWAQSAYGLLLWAALFLSIFAVGLVAILSRRRE